jgi:hypothetical protein
MPTFNLKLKYGKGYKYIKDITWEDLGVSSQQIEQGMLVNWFYAKPEIVDLFRSKICVKLYCGNDIVTDLIKDKNSPGLLRCEGGTNIIAINTLHETVEREVKLKYQFKAIELNRTHFNVIGLFPIGDQYFKRIVISHAQITESNTYSMSFSGTPKSTYRPRSERKLYTKHIHEHAPIKKELKRKENYAYF